MGRIKRFLLLDPRSQKIGGMGVLALTTGIAYSSIGWHQHLTLPTGLDVITRLIPIQVFGWAWLGVALSCLWVALFRRHSRGIVPMALLTTLAAMWWLSYLLSWILHDFGSRDYIVAGWFYGVATVASGLGRTAPPLPRREVRWTRRFWRR